MAHEFMLFAFTLMGFHSSFSLSGTEVPFYPVSPKLINLACKKCPAGFSTVCNQNEQSRCVKCAEGTYSEHASRRGTCKRCARCGLNEFEVLPCTLTSNVVCKECSTCPPGFGVLRPCEKTKDTVCKRCPLDKDGIGIYEDTDCGRGGDYLVHNRSRHHEETKDRVTVVRAENPWVDGRRNPKFQHKLTVADKEADEKLIVPGVHSVSPSPPSLFSSRTPTDAIARGTFLIISPVDSLPASSPQTEKTVYDKRHPTDHEVQGDDGNIPQSSSQKTGHNSTDTANPRRISSVSSSESLNGTKSPQEKGGGFKLGTEGVVGDNMHKEVMLPEPNSANDQEIFPHTQHWQWIVIAVVVVAVLVVASALNRLKRSKKTNGRLFVCPQLDCRRPRCMTPSDCCDSTSISSTAGSWAEEDANVIAVPVDVHESDSNQPTLHTFLPSENTIVAADVHHTTVFDVFNIRSLRYLTQAEATLDSTGGKLSAPDSDVTIAVDSGTVPEGTHQKFFFRVVYDETSLLRDIPETPDRTLISPVIECGPHDINLLKPVEITVPHCLFFDEIKKDSIAVYRCEQYSDKGTIQWEKVPSTSEKNGQSKAWFTVKKDSIHIKTKTFSFWSIFACGGSKKKRATVFFSRPSPSSDLIYLRFYIYSDSEDSKKRVETRDKERFPDSWKAAKEKPCTIHNGGNNIAVKLTEIQDGWELDKTGAIQTYPFEIAYHNGFRSNDSCDFAVKPTGKNVKPFSCVLWFQQEETNKEHTIYLNPGYDPRETIPSSSNEIQPSNDGSVIEESLASERQEECEGSQNIENGTNTVTADVTGHALRQSYASLGSNDEPVTERHLLCVHQRIARWETVLRYLGLENVRIEVLDAENRTISEKCYQGLLIWMRGERNASTRELCDALQRADCREALDQLSREGLVKEEQAKITDEKNSNNWTTV